MRCRVPSIRARDVLLVLGLLQWSCNSATWQGVAKGIVAHGAATSAGAAGPGATKTKFMIFGGRGHSTYLGCISCPEQAFDSVFNEYGPHGSEYKKASIFNSYGEFGSAYSQYSACSPYATDPPVIVDSDGNFYGRLTVNPYQPQATRNERWKAWVAVVCAR